ncbi:hypothetical protein B484DRAFT_435123 [Ochromonadaceae sp. CCMP2298]|nr:hypothetical protein B484DRAFT_435123 [Ochromonadaceae sp. CCMP2298]
MEQAAALQYLAGLRPRAATLPGVARELVPEAEIYGLPNPARLFLADTPAPFDSIPFRHAYMAAIGFQNYMGITGMGIGWMFRALLWLKDQLDPDSTTLQQFVLAADNAWPFGSQRAVLKPARAMRRCEREFIDALMRHQLLDLQGQLQIRGQQLNALRTESQARLVSLQEGQVQLAHEAELRRQTQDSLGAENLALRQQLDSLKGHALFRLPFYKDRLVRNGVGHAFLAGIAALAREPVNHHISAQLYSGQRAPTSNANRWWMGYANALAHPMFQHGGMFDASEYFQNPGLTNHTQKLFDTSINKWLLFCFCPSTSPSTSPWGHSSGSTHSHTNGRQQISGQGLHQALRMSPACRSLALYRVSGIF